MISVPPALVGGTFFEASVLPATKQPQILLSENCLGPNHLCGWHKLKTDLSQLQNMYLLKRYELQPPLAFDTVRPPA
ncbi:hypothetical protein LNV09_23980 [Paucibacter sp. B2R-40]|nr:hypothetical protein [Paucibacter sp. B2R-40]